jgi:two-component system OmpR family sensor kinase
MTRHFLGLYVLIVVTLAAVSWGQDRLLNLYGAQDASDDRALGVAMQVLVEQIANSPPAEHDALLATLSRSTGARLEILSISDLAGRDTLERLRRGEIAYLQGTGDQSWTLKQFDQDHVLAYESTEHPTGRSPLEWALTLVFYALIALAIMLWIWPLTRDLRELERSAASYGDRNWHYHARIKPHSQIYPLAETFRRMAARIDGLIASHKDMSNAVSHEIKTPLSRMKFEIELAQQATHPGEVQKSLNNLKTDIAAINDLVRATMEYAILERADVALNLDLHDFTALLPGIIQQIRQQAQSPVELRLEVQSEATKVRCDMHLLEAVVRNLVYNAIRYARHQVRVTFTQTGARNQLTVEDDGPGIPEKDRLRVFESFVQLNADAATKTGYGLGLAIVKRAIEWHAGEASVSTSAAGGACFRVCWPNL